MKIYALICTRDKDLSSVTTELTTYLSSLGVQVKLLVNHRSIFNGYSKALEKIDPDPSDIIILCHDDIEIQTRPVNFISILSILKNKKYGFLGVAGTTELGEDSVWWDQERWRRGKHKGKVFHLDPEDKVYTSEYGPYGQVVVLDGVFLACRAELLKEIALQKPTSYNGEWDFYDIYYTLQSHDKGYENHTVPIELLHHSRGELAGRESWHKNREAFIKQNKERFPIIC